ncbi:MAG: type III pantothenate kinase [Pseudomonadales bacterium]
MTGVLELDIGNTRAKWRVLDANRKPADRGHWAHSASALPADSELDGMIESTQCERVRVGSVAAEELNQHLQEWATARKLNIQFAQTSVACAGVSNSYDQPERMGVDRWLAMLAAFNRYPGNICVIDCGTALTLDVVTAVGKHLGGLIMPGVRLQQNALRQHTDKVIFSKQPDVGELRLGTDTPSCVHNGSMFMLVGAIHEVLLHAEQQLGADVQCVISGGDAALLLPLLEPVLQEIVIEAPDIVLDGLQYALP